MRMAKYSQTPIGYFLEMPISEFLLWMEIISGEIKRENREIKGIKK